MKRFSAIVAWGFVFLAGTAVVLAQTPGDRPAPASSDKMMMMKKMLTDDETMMMAKKAMMADESKPMKLAREILIQELMRDRDLMASMRKNMMMMENDAEMMKMMGDEKVMMSKDAMMKDKQALAMILNEIMCRQMAADRIAKMMKSDGARP